MNFSEWLEAEEEVGHLPCQHLGELAARMAKSMSRVHNFGMDQILPDGDGYRDREGTMNVYVNPPGGGTGSLIRPEQQQKVIRAALRYLSDMGVKVTGEVKRNTYKDFAEKQTRLFKRLGMELPDNSFDSQRLTKWADETSSGDPEAVRVYRIPVKLE